MAGYQWIVHDAMEDVEGEFERYLAHFVLTFPARVRFRLINTGLTLGSSDSRS